MPKRERAVALTRLNHGSSQTGMPLRAKPTEAEVTSRCEYVVKLKPAYPVRVRNLKVLFTYTFYLGPRSSIGGLFLCSALFRREPAPQSLKRFANFSVI